MFNIRLKMSCNLPAMIYSAPLDEGIVELDFDGIGNPNTTKGTKRNLKRRRRKSREQPYSQWNALPDIILEDVLARLSIRDRYYASQVCQNWNRIFYSPRVWNTFILEDRTLTRRKFNYYMGYQHVLDHHRTQICLHRMGRGFRRLVITPMENFFNLYEFMTIVSYFCEYFEDQPLSMVKTLDFTFGCDYAVENSAVSDDDKVFGTGGKLLEALKRMMDNLSGLKNLALQDLLLEKEEAKYLLDDVAYNCCETLRSLKLVNCTKEPYAMLHAGVFVNLHSLTLSPQHLSEDVISLLGYTKLKDLYLLQTRNVEGIVPVVPAAWKNLKKISPMLKVHHLVEGKIKTAMVWQEGAPIRSVIYDTPFSQVSISSVLSITSFYSGTLQVYVHMGLPRFYKPRSFEERADTALILLSRSCPNVHTLAIRERVSTATVLLLAHISRNLRRLVVRRNAMVKKCEWPHNPEWSDSFYDWLKETSRSYEATAQEVSRILGCRWAPLTDKEFKSFRL